MAELPRFVFLTHHFVRKTLAGGPTSTPERLAQQVDYLQAEKYTFLTCGQAAMRAQTGKVLPQRLAIFMFDDSLRPDHGSTVLPFLVARQIPATFFCITGPFDGKLPAFAGL